MTEQSPDCGNEFMDLVARMRAAQREYFRTRDRAVLQRSKELERQVDRCIADTRNPGLF